MPDKTPHDIITEALSTEELGHLTNADDAWLTQTRRWAQTDATQVITALTTAGYHITSSNPQEQIDAIRATFHAPDRNEWKTLARIRTIIGETHPYESEGI